MTATTPQPDIWHSTHHPIIGLSPMDGVTDAACRAITAIIAKPHLIFSEFVPVEGLRAGAVILLTDFLYQESERPIIAQLYGADPSAFYDAAIICAELGFDGVDINMGCPAKSVSNRGAGAGLIRDPERAVRILSEAKRGLTDWANGIALEQTSIHPRYRDIIRKRHAVLPAQYQSRRLLPLSLKTRIGVETPVVTEWLSALIPTQPAAISLHGRTLKQLYTGQADWDSIGEAAALLKGTGIPLLGNGDVHSVEEGMNRCKEYGTNGFLIGRAAIGNPWVFAGHTPTQEERLQVAIEHCKLVANLYPPTSFVRVRRHLLHYAESFPGAKTLRTSLSHINTLDDAISALTNALTA